MAASHPTIKNQTSAHNQVADIYIDVPYQLKDKALFNIPAVCTCCLAPTENKYTAGWSSSRKYSTGTQRVTETHTARLDFCVCPDCVEHQREYNRKRIRMIIISVLCSAVVSSALIYFFNNFLEGIFGSGLIYFLVVLVLVPVVIALPVLATLDVFIPQRILDRRHASLTVGVRMIGPHHFEFDNLVYAQLFEKMNSEGAKISDGVGGQLDLPYKSTKVLKSPALNYKVFGKSLLEGKPLFEILILTAVFSCILTFLCSMALHFMLRDPNMAGSPGMYVCSGFLLLIIISIIVEEWRRT